MQSPHPPTPPTQDSAEQRANRGTNEKAVGDIDMADPPEANLSSNWELPEQSRALPALASLNPYMHPMQKMQPAVRNKRQISDNSTYVNFLFLFLQLSLILYFLCSPIPFS
jgi:hypothetical protein